MTALARYSAIVGALIATATLLTLLYGWTLKPVRSEMASGQKALSSEIAALSRTVDLLAWALVNPDSSEARKEATRLLTRRWMETREVKVGP